MITTEGKTHIKRYLAGFVPSIAQSLAFGIGDKAEAVGDTRLHFEADRVDIALTSYDFVNDRLVFKASFPTDFEGTIYEVGIFSSAINEVAGEFGSRLLASFDSASEEWLDATSGAAGTYFTGTTSRIKPDSLRDRKSVV